METSMVVYVVIPAYNESKVIAEVIAEIKQQGWQRIIVVDDGSSDDTFAKCAQCQGVVALRHRLNRGKGAATQTGIEAACRLGADIVVTMDGDGQHDPEDIASLVEPIRVKQYDAVLGTRMKNSQGMPGIKKIANIIGNICTLALYGILVSDSQSGFRAYSRYAAQAIDTKADKYEYDSKVIREIQKNNLKYLEVPIKVRYTEHSKNKPQKQGFVNGIRTLFRMIIDKIV